MMPTSPKAGEQIDQIVERVHFVFVDLLLALQRSFSLSSFAHSTKSRRRHPSHESLSDRPAATGA